MDFVYIVLGFVKAMWIVLSETIDILRKNIYIIFIYLFIIIFFFWGGDLP